MNARVGSATVIVSRFAFGPPLADCLARLLRDAPDKTDVIVAESDARGAGAGADEAIDRRVRIVRGISRAAAMNAAIAAAAGDVIVLLPSFVEPVPSLIPLCLARFDDDPRVALVHGSYTIKPLAGPDVLQPVLAWAGDLSESSTIGYVAAVRRSALAEVGGYDASYHLAEEYDLRLRLTRRFRLARIAEPLCRIDLSSISLDREEVRAELGRFFTPESSARPGFGYLDYSPAIEAEVERAFRSELRARGAELTGGPEPFDCPHAGCRPMASVVIPTYNRAAWVRRAIESVLEGRFRDFEVLVIDGGSTDDTVAEVEAIGRRHPAVRLLRNPQNHVAGSLNVGLRAAGGKYVLQLDSDDEYAPETIKAMIASLEAHPDWGLATSYYDFIDENSNPLAALGTVRHLEYDRNNILRTGGVGAVRAWHRCALERLGGFDEARFPHYAEDYDLILRLSERYVVGRVPAVLYHCRRHAQNSEERLTLEYRAQSKALARRRALARRSGGRGRAAEGTTPVG